MASWVWGGMTFLHFLVYTVVATTLSFLLIAAFLTPLWKEMKDWFNPSTPGGLGDMPDDKGVPAHERLAKRKE